jgi:hypothetical protein
MPEERHEHEHARELLRAAHEAVERAQHLVSWSLHLAGDLSDRWLTKAEVCAYSGRSARTVERAVAAGELEAGGTPGKRAYRKSAVDRWLAGGGSVLALLLALLVVGLAVLVLARACGAHCGSAHEMLHRFGLAPGVHRHALKARAAGHASARATRA